MKRAIYCLGNWKMNQKLSDIESFAKELSSQALPLHINVGFAPQAIHLMTLRKQLAKPILVGAQNCSDQKPGAFTGELAVEALLDAQMDFSLVGHSERRQLFNESNELLKNKLSYCLENQLQAIFCIGETLTEFEAGKTMSVLKKQLEDSVIPVMKSMGHSKNLVIAYEPVWAIGTGKTATTQIIAETLAGIRNLLKQALPGAEQVSLLYGGSVKAENSTEIASLADVDGVLVGGASLDAKIFAKIIQSFAEQKSPR